MPSLRKGAAPAATLTSRDAAAIAYEGGGSGPALVRVDGRLAQVAVPTLVMCGGAGEPFMQDAARAVGPVVPRGEMRVIAGQSHNVQPAALVPALTQFFTA